MMSVKLPVQKQLALQAVNGARMSSLDDLGNTAWGFATQPDLVARTWKTWKGSEKMVYIYGNWRMLYSLLFKMIKYVQQITSELSSLLVAGIQDATGEDARS